MRTKINKTHGKRNANIPTRTVLETPAEVVSKGLIASHVHSEVVKPEPKQNPRGSKLAVQFTKVYR